MKFSLSEPIFQRFDVLQIMLYTRSKSPIMVKRKIMMRSPGTSARILLDGQNGPWDRAKVEQIVKGGKRTIVTLEQKIPVHLTYQTAWHDEDGVLHFNEHLYGRDKKLRAALDHAR